jgi:hypothetical protein
MHGTSTGFPQHGVRARARGAQHVRFRR